MTVLNQLHKVVARPVSIADSVKTRVNTGLPGGHMNDLFIAMSIVPVGALAGMVATIDSNGNYAFCDDDAIPAGLFGLDAAGDDFESMRPRNSGKMTLISLGYHEVEIYETRAAAAMGVANGLLASYVPGVKLYCSAQGLLTTELSASEEAIAIVEKAPTAEDTKMIVKLLV